MSHADRIRSIDVLRGIAIIAIVFGHMGIIPINKVVFTFHVTAFFVLSGYFLNENEKYSVFVKKKIRRLLIPYGLTAAVMIVLGFLDTLLFADWEGYQHLSMVLGDQNTDQVMLRIKFFSEGALQWVYAALYGAGDSYYEPFYIKSIGAIWFLLACFWGNIFLRKLLDYNKWIRIILLCVLFLFGYYTRSICWFPLSIQAGCCATLFMYFGYLARQLKSVWSAVGAELKTVIRVMAALVWISFIHDFQSFWLVHCDVGRGVIDIVGSLCACYVVFLIAELIDRKAEHLSAVLEYMGKNSLLILCIHNIEMFLYPWEQLKDYLAVVNCPYIAVIAIILIVKFIMILLGVYLCRKSNFLLKIFGLKAV